MTKKMENFFGLPRHRGLPGNVDEALTPPDSDTSLHGGHHEPRAMLAAPPITVAVGDFLHEDRSREARQQGRSLLGGFLLPLGVAPDYLFHEGGSDLFLAFVQHSELSLRPVLIATSNQDL